MNSTISLHDKDTPRKFRESIDCHGFVVVEDAYTKEELAALRDGVLALEAKASPHHKSFVYQGGHLWAVWNLYELSPTLMRLAFVPDPFGLMAECAGTSLEFCRATLMKKTPGAQQSVGWHQDIGVAVDRDVADVESRGIRDGVPHRSGSTGLLNQMIIARINVEPQYEDGGCLQVIPGSHKWGRLRVEELKRRVGDEKPLLCPVHAGSILFYQPLLAHASGPNTRMDTSNQRRVLHNEFRTISAKPDGGVDWFPWMTSARVEKDGVFFRAQRGRPSQTTVTS
jgi:ectoine hydroxylase-related dioxygenase (phytanoyl-CoA dioxygenase family)